MRKQGKKNEPAQSNNALDPARRHLQESKIPLRIPDTRHRAGEEAADASGETATEGEGLFPESSAIEGEKREKGKEEWDGERRGSSEKGQSKLA